MPCSFIMSLIPISELVNGKKNKGNLIPLLRNQAYSEMTKLLTPFQLDYGLAERNSTMYAHCGVRLFFQFSHTKQEHMQPISVLWPLECSAEAQSYQSHCPRMVGSHQVWKIQILIWDHCPLYSEFPSQFGKVQTDNLTNILGSQSIR